MFQGDEAVELHGFGLREGCELLLMPLFRHLRKEGQFVSHGDAVDAQEKGDAEEGDPGAEQLGHFRVDPELVQV
jgi:hypothetical protein